jgi:hypothetical protein
MLTGIVERYFDDIKIGRIAGAGIEYVFRRADWLSPAEPRAGMTVNFESPDGRAAVKIIAAAQGTISAEAG